jgi:branched-chain amino acid transport system permease protein
MLLLETGVPLAVAVVLSGLTAGGLALATSVALLRLRGAYFAIGSLAVSLAILAWMVTWQRTGGSKGLNLPISDLPSQDAQYFLALALVVCTCAIAWWFEHSSFGLRVMAVRDHEDAARALGVNGTTIKAAVLTLSGFLTGILASLVAFNQIALVPENLFGLVWVINMIVMTIVGGLGTVAGPLVGAGLIYWAIEKQLEGHPAVATSLAGALVLVVISVTPGGIWGALVSAARLAASLGRRRALRRMEGLKTPEISPQERG